MRSWILFLLLIGGNYISLAQTNLRAQYALSRLSDNGGLSPNETVFGIPRAPGKVIGDIYYDTAFRICSINLYKSEVPIRNIPARYNLESKELEFKHPLGLRVLSSEEVKSFAWKNNVGPVYFINAKDFKYKNSNLIGFLEIISEGEITVVKRKEIVYKKGHYVPALNAGSDDVEIIIKEKFYFIRNTELLEVPSNKKKLAESFPEYQQQILSFIKTNGIDISKERGLKLLFDNINNLKQN